MGEPKILPKIVCFYFNDRFMVLSHFKACYNNTMYLFWKHATGWAETVSAKYTLYTKKLQWTHS